MVRRNEDGSISVGILTEEKKVVETKAETPVEAKAETPQKKAVKKTTRKK